MDNSDINKALEDIEKAKRVLFAQERIYNKTVKGLSSEAKKHIQLNHKDISDMFDMMRSGDYNEDRINEIIKTNER